jgi:hypothetical protein
MAMSAHMHANAPQSSYCAVDSQSNLLVNIILVLAGTS